MAVDGADWRCGKTLPQCLSHLRMSDHMTDVTFTFNDGSEVKGHRLLLAARSEVFEAMFYGPAKDTSDQVNIVDIKADAFEMMLEYIYSDTVKLEGKHVLSCLYAAQKYGLTGLVSLCTQFLERAMGPDNVCKILQQSTMFSMADLSKLCYDFIGANSNDVFQSAGFVTCLSQSLLGKVLAHEDIATPEIDVFNALLRWAKVQCTEDEQDESPTKIREIMGDTLYQVRFPVIPMPEFKSVVVASDILTRQETKSLMKYMTSTSNKEDTVCEFPTKTRQGLGYLVSISPPEMELFRSVTVTCIPIDIRTDQTLCLKALLFCDALAIRSVAKYINGHEPNHNITKNTKLLKDKKTLVFIPPLVLRSRDESVQLYLEPGEYFANDPFREKFNCLGVSGCITTTGVVSGVRFVKDRK